jgi:predicted HNH restriction endonuclease
MPRPRLSIERVLNEIATNEGKLAAATAKRIIDFVVSLGAQPWPRQKAVALRIPGRVDTKPAWLTVAVVSTAGTIYNDWHDRWSGAGASDATIKSFERAMIEVFGEKFVSHPSAFRSAAKLDAARQNWPAVEAGFAHAVDAINRAVRSGRGTQPSTVEPQSTALSALEGQLTETRAARRGRNSRLRRTALARAKGVCAACGVNYGEMLGGRGRRVLQVHHRQQLSDRDSPDWTSIDDLDVVCANCHLLIHVDKDAPMPVESLRNLFGENASNTR